MKPTKSSLSASQSDFRIQYLYPYFSLFARLLLGGLFLYAGAIKLVDMQNFMYDIENYRLIPHSVLPLLAISLPAIEIIAGLCLILGLWTEGALTIITTLMVVFIAAITSAVWRGLDISCGCFGTSDAEQVGWSILLRDYVLLLIAVPLWLNKKPFLQLDSLIVRTKEKDGN
ncbi:MAG: MauE/DoxX family redox-associated membrane protein [bacterium]|jgi:uncharacterized membrane protein YphA (DoxX/SURF4 family)|nr:MauE/DoxX family redox-associated membrane protein [bacterium]